MKTQNAIIKSAALGIEDHRFLSSFVHLDLDDGWSQGFGGYALGGPFAALWIEGVLAAADVNDWSKLVGRVVRIRKGDGFNATIAAIGHAIKNDRWFAPKEAFDAPHLKAYAEEELVRRNEVRAS